MAFVQTISPAGEEFTLFPSAAAHATSEWFAGEEGQLSIDVTETDDVLIVTSPIAGVEPRDLEVFLQNDMLTIRGRRHEDERTAEGRQLIRECHWGAFSRSIILPAEIRQDDVVASLTNGVLRITLPKRLRPIKKITIR